MMTGPKCDQPRCPSDCNGRGLCMNGMCACWSFYAGRECEMPIKCQEMCLDICNQDGESMRTHCNKCIGMCESSAPRSSSVFGGPPLGVHNPFEDLQTTLLQNNATGKNTRHSKEWIALRRKMQMQSKASNKKMAQTHRKVAMQKKRQMHGELDTRKKMLAQTKTSQGVKSTKRRTHRTHHEVKRAAGKRKAKPRSHREVYHRPAKLGHAKTNLSLLQEPHVSTRHHTHHHAEVSATRILKG